MYIMAEVVPRLQHKADPKDLRKAVAPAVQEFESRGEFLTKLCQAWSGHPAAPMGLAVAGRNSPNRVSTSKPGTRQGTHQLCDLAWGRRGSIRRAKRIVGHNPCSLKIKGLEGKCNVERETYPGKDRVYFLFCSMISRGLCGKCMRCIVVGNGSIEELLTTLVRLLVKRFLPTCPWTTMLTTCTCGKAEKGRRVSVRKGADRKGAAHWSSHFSLSALKSIRRVVNAVTVPEIGRRNSLHHAARVFLFCFL